VSNYDFMPTLLSYLGLSDRMAQSPESPGRDYSAVLQGRMASLDNVVFYEYENSRMVRTDRWKLTRRFPAGPDELYDLVGDPGEKTNLFGKAEQAAVQGQLQDKLDAFFKRYADPKYDLWKGGISKAPLVSMRGTGARQPATSQVSSAPAE
jgi:arylsulfatase A-like enzyme